MAIDNREYFYHKVKYNPLFGLEGMTLLRRFKYTMGTIRRRWIYRVRIIEAKLAERHPMIFPSLEAKQDFCSRFDINDSEVFVLKNYPSITEIRDIKTIKVRKNVSFIYVGKDLPSRTPYRNLNTTVNVLCSLANKYKVEVLVAGINYDVACFHGIGWLSLNELYEMLTSVDYGLVSWDPHYIHWYFSPVKAYQYAVSGCVPVITDTLKSLVKDMRNLAIVVRANDKNSFKMELKRTLEELIMLNRDDRISLREKVMHIARMKLIWENQEMELIECIKKAQ